VRNEPTQGTRLSEEQFFTRNELSRGMASLGCERFHEREQPWTGLEGVYTVGRAKELTAENLPQAPSEGCMGLETRLKCEKKT